MTDNHTAEPSIAVTGNLTLEDMVRVARSRARVQPLPDAADRIAQSAAWVAGAMRGNLDRPIAYYGINTGFGDNAGRAIFERPAQAEQLSRNLLLSHTIGVGDPLPEDAVRASMLIRAAILAKGYSGVRRVVINTLLMMLNRDVYPWVPAQGSLGASGDLAPLAHLVIPLSEPLPAEVDTPGATGFCYLDGERVTGAQAMAAANIRQVRLGAKEGLALINGTAVSAAIAALVLFDAERLYRWSQVSLALSLEALRGFRDAFLPQINRLRSPTQATFAADMLRLLSGSTFVRGDQHIDLSGAEGPPQDPYCLRCSPAVMGAVGHTLAHVRSVIEAELNAVTDNPLVFGDELPRDTKVISGSNFHGEPLAFAADFLSIVMSEVASIAERRIFTLTDPKLNRGLPAFLIKEPPETAGLNSGLMMAHTTAAALVSENKSLAHPASVDSLPSSANREDHVSMSTIAARKAAQIVNNARRVIGLELLCASQAVSLRAQLQPELKLGVSTQIILDQIRQLEIAAGLPLNVIERDVPLAPYLDAILGMLETPPNLPTAD